MTHRVDHVDIAKGISIILVALFHSKMRAFVPGLIDAMSVFRMPLFFFLSGVFFAAPGSPGEFFRRKSDALLKPYFATLVLAALLAWLGLQMPAPKIAFPEFAGILYGNGDVIRLTPLWFLTHLFALYGFAYLVLRYTGFQRCPAPLQLGMLAAMLLVGDHFLDAFWRVPVHLGGTVLELPGLPFGLDLLLVSSAFFLAGALLKSRVVSFRPNPWWALAAALAFLSVTLFTDAHMDLNKRVYDAPVATTLGAACGIYLILFLSFHLQKIGLARRVLLSFGGASLFVLIFHSYIGRETYKALDRAGADNLNLLFATLAFLLSITAPLAIRAAISRIGPLALLYFPLRSNPLAQRAGRNTSGAPPTAPSPPA